MKIAFGNVNSDTGWDAQRAVLHSTNILLNGYNRSPGTYKGASYGLVEKLENKKIKYSSGIAQINLFNEEDYIEENEPLIETIGKTRYDDRYSLRFERNADTYVLKSVVDKTKDIKEQEILQNLDTFSHPGVYDGVQNKNVIWTNHFWPMDYAESYGSNGHDMKFGSEEYKTRRNYANNQTNKTANLAPSDDALDHNSYFGMQLSIDFFAVPDYVGPLEYYFFGDDDLWVFLDGDLICDIGGVHSSVGEYTNLWDYVERDGNMHTLSIYYTERGASGSTCWMHFNLPHPLADATPDRKIGSLTVEKNVINVDTDQKFNFELSLTDDLGNPLTNRYNFITNFGTKGYIENGSQFILVNGEKITIKGIPAGAKYSIREVGTESTTTAIPFEQFTVGTENSSGTIQSDTESYAKFTNAYNHTFAKVEKVWDDDNNSAGTRPETGVNVKLTAKTKSGADCSDYVKSVKPEVQFEVNLNETNSWKYEWQNLPKYRITKNGDIITGTDEITYTIDEIETEELKENYFLLSKVQRDNTTIITNASYKNILLTKVDTEDEGKKLAGAQFKLEKLLNDNDDTDMTVDTTFEPLISTVTGSDGKFSFEKLKFGRYQLTEIKTPEGYNTIKKPIVISVRQNIIKMTNPTILLEERVEVPTEGKLIIDLGKIGNRKGITLTETGGTGTKIFTITGLAIVTVSLSLLTPKQKISFTEAARQRRKKRMAKKYK